VAVPDATLIDQLDLPGGQGLVVDEVLADSPAARAGLRVHDVLLALDGRPVPADPWRFARQVEAYPADVPLTALVVRRAQRETLAGLVLPEVPPAREPFPRPFGFPGRPAVGAGVMIIPGSDWR
jgi:S1-C subfamily serine protease